MLFGEENGFGVTGIIPSAQKGWSGVVAASFPNFWYWPAAAITNAAADLGAGEIILIEQHTPGPIESLTCVSGCNCAQFGYIPMEWYPAEFTAVSLATATASWL
jgi:hypothetical protein